MLHTTEQSNNKLKLTKYTKKFIQHKIKKTNKIQSKETKT